MKQIKDVINELNVALTNAKNVCFVIRGQIRKLEKIKKEGDN